MTREPDLVDVALMVGHALERAGCAWMIGGSLATSAHGEPRATHDVDIVADVVPSRVEAFLHGLGGRFYADEAMIRDAIRRRASFNVIHYETTDKIDVFCLRADPFARAGLRDRTLLDLGEGRIAPVASAGHMVVEKLRWYRLGGEVSDRQWRDVQGVLQVSGASLEVDRLRRWADEVGVRDLLERALVDAGST